MSSWPPKLKTLLAVADPYDVIVLDQWGVLHDGTAPYPGAAKALTALSQQGKRLAVLSNSGKRAAVNAKRISAIGLPMKCIELTMTSGEAFWLDCATGHAKPGRTLAITGNPADAAGWAKGLDVKLVDKAENAETVLLMGLPEGSDGSREAALLDEAADFGLPVVCTNPDRASPRADGVVQTSPGALAKRYQDRGGVVTYYGKPYRPIYERLLAELGLEASSCLMVGDSLEHDVAGAQSMGMATAFVTAGLYATHFKGAEDPIALTLRLARDHNVNPPTHVIDRLG